MLRVCGGVQGWLEPTYGDVGVGYEVAETTCDGVDSDCDGVVDEGCGCKPGRVQSCFLGPENQLEKG